MKKIVETERLRLREFDLDDADFIIELVNSPGWIKYIGDRNIKTKTQAEEYLQHGPLKSYHMNGFGLSMVETKAGNVPIGMCGIIRRADLEVPDIGFALLPAYMSNGYAYEIASATLAYAKKSLNLPVIWAITVHDNERSIKLLEKLGFSFSKMIEYGTTTEELMLFIKDN